MSQRYVVYFALPSNDPSGEDRPLFGPVDGSFWPATRYRLILASRSTDVLERLGVDALDGAVWLPVHIHGNNALVQLALRHAIENPPSKRADGDTVFVDLGVLSL